MVRVNKMGPALLPITAALCGFMLAFPAVAQEGADTASKRPTVLRSAAPSPNATINLINLLVQQGVITQEQATALIKQSEDDAYVAREAVRNAAAKADGAEKTAAAAADAVSPPGTKRVTYVPEIVKKQLREDIRREVMEKAQKERWAASGAVPEWVSRVRFFGDVRVRYEGDFFPKGNNPLTAVNYNAINSGNPYDTGNTNGNFWPTFDTDQNRNRDRLRARLGLEADLSGGFWAGLRIATGDSNAPVSFNQSLGGSGGDFSKYAIWLDRAYIKYAPWSDVAFIAGRFDNPFFSPTDLVYHQDLGFDGFAARVRREVAPGITPYARVGAFPIFNTDLNAGSNQPLKSPSQDKWMFGGQLGSNFHIVPEVEFTFGAAYYDFTNVQGRVSSPCIVANTTDVCDTDFLRPSFAQKGNTYMALRNIPLFDGAGQPNAQLQFYGLASKFRDVNLSARLDLGQFDPVHVVLDGEYVQNVAFNRADIADRILANLIPAGGAVAPTPPGTSPNTSYDGGNKGWLARLTVGDRELKKLWDWNAHVGYKLLESDAVIDAFTDSDFGLGGTNLKGYFVGANLALGANVWTSVRWMSANQAAGSPYAVDIVQVDLNAKY
jgi:Putative porin